MTKTAPNPFIEAFKNKSFQTRDEAIPFENIHVDHFLPALDFAIQDAREQVAKICSNSETPNFENTILALDSCADLAETIQTVYFNLFSAEASESHQALAREISPKFAAFTSELTLNPILFQKIKAVFDHQDQESLNAEQKKLVEKYYEDFRRNGALLSEDQKEVLRSLDQEISVLGPQFSENILKSTNSFELWIDNKSDLLGLPESVIEAAAQEATHKGQPGRWLFTLQAPSFMAFVKYAKNRELRKRIWLAFNSRAFQGENSNQALIKKIVGLREKRAKLLSFSTHADFVLSRRMAQDPKNVLEFLNRLLAPSKKAAEKEMAELREFKKSIDGNEEIMPWDFAYYSELLKEKKYKFSQEELRPYFQLEKVVSGVFEHSRRLYGLTFHEVFDVQKYHPDVRTYEVKEETTGKYIGLLYTDFFPRDTKKSGAWMTAYREQGLTSGVLRRPHISIVCNFTKPTSTKPSLLTYDEVSTLFHEFGHALHGLLSQVTYRSLSGTNVYWDFVELPSQIMENWVREKEGLDVFAVHYQTGVPIPADLVEKVRKAAKFQAGYFSLRQLTFGFLDMKWHSTAADQIQSVDQFEQDAVAPLRILPHIEGTNVSCSFSHIFAGGYSAGYYSYKWAEVLDADAFEYFKEKGLFNRDVATKFKNNILSRGGTEHPMELYKKFRGREPDPQALLRRDGLTA